MIELSHLLVEVGLVPLIHRSLLLNDRSETLLSTLTYDARKLMLKFGEFLIVRWVLETFHAMFVRLAVFDIDRGFLALLLFTFSCS